MKPESVGLNYQAIVLGVSAGGHTALPKALAPLPANFPVPVIVVQHRHPQDYGSFYIKRLNANLHLTVKEAVEKEAVAEGTVYVAPANYHLLLEQDRTFSLTVDEKVNYSRPSIDVLFESAADACGAELVGIILTGANSDGARGMKRIKECGGKTIAQDPKDAEYPLMPQSAIDVGEIDYVLSLNEISKFLGKLTKKSSE